MRGPNILARSMSVATSGAGKSRFAHGNSWQYHPRSDRHSKIACWGLLLDLVETCPLLRAHLQARKVAIGINHEMHDFAQNRRKNLDLVVCTSRSGSVGARDFAGLVQAYSIQLDAADRIALGALPAMPLAAPATVLLAVEAKACMTEFGKAQSRLYDELNSSHLTIHGDTESAIAAGLVMVNAASSFVSPLRNAWPSNERAPVVSAHVQPRDAQSMVDKLVELPRRSQGEGQGFDAVATLMVECRNDGSSVTLANGPGVNVPAIFDYDGTVRRLAHIYATRFSSI